MESDHFCIHQINAEIHDTTTLLRKKFPDLMKSFYNSFIRIDDDRALTKKTKRLISLGGSLVKQCHWCVIYYIQKALEAGATSEEIIEASLVAIKMNGESGLYSINWVIESLRDLGKLEKK